MAYCIYLRKSRADLEAEQQGEMETLARHETALLALAERSGLEVGRIYREIASGESISCRPVMKHLIREVEQGLWDGVLVMEVERLARGDTIDQGTVAQAFQYTNTKIITPVKTYDPGNEFDEEYFEFGLFMSRREYKAINRRLQRGRQASVMEGKYVGSLPPYGYEKEKLAAQKGYTLRPHPRQAEIVRQIFAWAAFGEEGRGMGACAIAGRLNSLGILPQRGARWTPSTIKGILENPVYLGKLRWRYRPQEWKMEEGRRIQRRPRNEECILVEGLHPPLVEAALWQKAQNHNRPHRAERQVGKGMKNPLAGLVFCGECGRRMVRKPYGGQSPDVLLCATPGCQTVAAYLADVERQLISSLDDWLGELRISAETDTPLPMGLASFMRDEVEMLQQQKNRLYELLEMQVYNIATFESRRRVLDERMELANKALEDDAKKETNKGAVDRQWQTGGITLVEMYALAESPALKNALLKELVHHVEYRKSTGGRWKPGFFDLDIYPYLPQGGSGEEAMDT